MLTPALAAVTSTLRALIASPPPEVRPLLLPYDPARGGVLRAIDLREVHLSPGTSVFAESGGTEDNPVFVLVDDKPIRVSKKSVDWCLAAIERCWEQKVRGIHANEREDARRAYDEARAVYRKIREECAGD